MICVLSFQGCTPKQKVIWESFDAQKLAAAQNSKMPVVLDFYADWCVACHELDDYTYSDPRVIQALNPFKRLQVNVTSSGNKEVMDLAERFNVEGLPTVIFLDGEGKEIKDSRIEGFFPPNKFLKLIASIPTASQPPAETNAKVEN